MRVARWVHNSLEGIIKLHRQVERVVLFYSSLHENAFQHCAKDNITHLCI